MATSTPVNTGAIKATLNAVSSAGNAVSSIFSATTDVISMGHSFISEAASNQKERQLVNKRHFRTELAAESGQRMLALQDRISEITKGDKNRVDLFQSEYNEVLALLNPDAKKD